MKHHLVLQYYTHYSIERSIFSEIFQTGSDITILRYILRTRNIVISETVQLTNFFLVGLRYYTDYNILCAIFSEKSIPVSEITILRILHNYKPLIYGI